MDPQRIARRYLQSWFVIDVITAIPIDILVHRQLRSFALLKTLRLLRARKLLQSSARARSSNVLRVVLTLATWLLLAHWAACIFYALGYYSVLIIPTASPPTAPFLTGATARASRAPPRAELCL